MDGRRTRPGVVVRSDTLGELGAARAAMLAYGVRTVVDLRLPEQASRNPSPFAAPGGHGVAYHSLPFAGPVDTRLPEYGSLERQYRLMVPAFAEVAPAVMSAVAGGAGTALVHCEYGKDRSGLVCALLLELAGVPRGRIVEDYAATAGRLRPVFDDFLANGPGERTEREAELARFAPRPEVMTATLAAMDAEHGGPEGFLLAAGVPPAVIRRLRERLV